MAPADGAAQPAPVLRVTVAYSPAPGQVDQTALALAAGSTAGDALQASGLLLRHPEAAQLPLGVWGRKEAPGTRLRDGDRVEVYRPLLCDPKEARRLRYRQNAEKTAASAAKTRAGRATPKP